MYHMWRKGKGRIIYPPPPIALAPMLFYPTELLFYENNNKQVSLINYPKIPLYLE